MVDIGWSAAVNGVADGGVLRQIVLQVHDRLGSPDEQDSVVVVQPTHLIWGQQFAATLLKIGGVGTRAAFALTVRLGIDRSHFHITGNESSKIKPVCFGKARCMR